MESATVLSYQRRIHVSVLVIAFKWNRLQVMVTAETVVMNIYSWINPYLLLLSSSQLRRQTVAFLLRKGDLSTPTGNGNAARMQQLAMTHRSRPNGAVGVAWPENAETKNGT